MTPFQLILATGNPGKVREFETLLSPLGWHVVPAGNLGLKMPEELTRAQGATFHSNAALKAEQICQQANSAWVLADDSGIVLDALQGGPGVDTATFGGPDYLLQVLADMGPETSREGKVGAILALARPGQPTLFFEGWERLTIANERRGEGGFGYDSVLIAEGFTETFAERIDRDGLADVKGQSHRGRAIQAFLEWIQSHK